MKTTLGGDRLGSGGKMKVDLRTYNRSTHDLSYLWKSTMSVGTLVPFMSEVLLPGDNFEIKLDYHGMTIPTNGPLFGKFKVQLDVFSIPIRLYIKELHNNKMDIGLNMKNINLPQVELKGVTPPNEAGSPSIAQIEPSTIWAYLNIMGIGRGSGLLSRKFNALSYISYLDIYKNYYANKMEQIGAVIHTPIQVEDETVGAGRKDGNTSIWQKVPDPDAAIWIGQGFNSNNSFNYFLQVNPANANIDPNRVTIKIQLFSGHEFLFNSTQFDYSSVGDERRFLLHNPPYSNGTEIEFVTITYDLGSNNFNQEPHVELFDLDDIDELREYLLTNSNVVINDANVQLVDLALQNNDNAEDFTAAYHYSQEGLLLKTYQSDLFNNWLDSEMMNGSNGINEITKVMVQDGGIILDELNLMNKVYLMLNRVAVSDGTYKSWLETVWDNPVNNWVVESPVYHGGLIKELTFDEVISTAENESQPLGTLAGRGVMTNKHKGGYLTVKADEPSILMGIVSLTPIVDYSQGNKWDVNLKTMDDFHKPQLDGIGFQDLITDQMAWFDTEIDENEVIFKSAGKQPAWTNYMTNVNQVKGNFAIDGKEMFMTLNRKYEYDSNFGIFDLTTYIDPVKYNDVFSYGKIDAQNFWSQIKVDIKARRKMSARIMPNL
jgi:hypothetical protein